MATFHYICRQEGQVRGFLFPKEVIQKIMDLFDRSKQIGFLSFFSFFFFFFLFVLKAM